MLSLPIGEDLLEVHNSMWTGEEKIYFNGQLASSGSSVFGRTHYFTVDAADSSGDVDKFRVEISMTWFGSVTVDVFRNDRCLLASNRTPISRVDGPARLDQPTAPRRHVRRLDSNKHNDTDPLDEDYFV